jgi:hypothetical protein
MDNPNNADTTGSSEDGDFIPFHPTEMDVVATKIRTWNSKHLGNQFYTDIVQEIIQTNTFPLESPSDFRRAAEHVHHVVCVERGGRFLKLPEGMSSSVVCTVMSEQDVINKVIHALKTAKKRKELRDAGIIPPPFIKAAQCGLQPFKMNLKKPRSTKTQTQNVTDVGLADNELVTPTPTSKNNNSSSSSSTKRKQSLGSTKRPNDNDNSPTLISRPKKRFKVTYEAVIVTTDENNKEQDGSSGVFLRTYALKLISRVCSQPGDPSRAHYVLDKPIDKEYNVHTEPEKQRLLRLQLRQRFASAVAVGFTPIEFARKLLKLWGGELRQVILEPLPTPISKSAAATPPPPPTTTATPKKPSKTPFVDVPATTSTVQMEDTPHSVPMEDNQQLQCHDNPSPTPAGETIMMIMDNVANATLSHQEAAMTEQQSRLELQEAAIAAEPLVEIGIVQDDSTPAATTTTTNSNQSALSTMINL